MEERVGMADLAGGTRDSAEMDGDGNGTPEVADLDDDMLQGVGPCSISSSRSATSGVPFP